eukprot:1884670-Karenia_brevis.AAC.1
MQMMNIVAAGSAGANDAVAGGAGAVLGAGLTCVLCADTAARDTKAPGHWPCSSACLRGTSHVRCWQ